MRYVKPIGHLQISVTYITLSTKILHAINCFEIVIEIM